MFLGELNTIEFVIFVVAVFIFLSALVTSIVSFFEKEHLAAERAMYAAIFLPVPLVLYLFLQFPYKEITGIVILSIFVIGNIILFFPTGKRKITEDDNPREKLDERDVMFSRARLEPGSDRFDNYYENNSEKKDYSI